MAFSDHGPAGFLRSNGNAGAAYNVLSVQVDEERQAQAHWRRSPA